MSYGLWVGDEYQGEFTSLNEVYYKLDSCFEGVGYGDELCWVLVCPECEYSFVMAGGHWEALCEDSYAFRLWLGLQNSGSLKKK